MIPKPFLAMQSCLNSTKLSVAVFLPWKVEMNVFSPVISSPRMYSSRIDSLNPTRLYFCMLSVCSEKSFEVVPVVISDCEILRLAVKMSFFKLLRKTTAVDDGTFEVKSSDSKISQSDG